MSIFTLSVSQLHAYLVSVAWRKYFWMKPLISPSLNMRKSLTQADQGHTDLELSGVSSQLSNYGANTRFTVSYPFTSYLTPLI